MKPELIYVDAYDGMVTMKKEEFEALVEKVYQAGKSSVPSAQPEIIRCKDCVCWDSSGYCVDFMTQCENGFCCWAEKRTDG